MTGYKLYYFELRARGEICRLSFKAAKIDFEDIRLNFEEWAKEKACEYQITISSHTEK